MWACLPFCKQAPLQNTGALKDWHFNWERSEILRSSEDCGLDIVLFLIWGTGFLKTVGTCTSQEISNEKDKIEHSWGILYCYLKHSLTLPEGGFCFPPPLTLSFAMRPGRWNVSENVSRQFSAWALRALIWFCHEASNIPGRGCSMSLSAGVRTRGAEPRQPVINMDHEQN